MHTQWRRFTFVLLLFLYATFCLVRVVSALDPTATGLSFSDQTKSTGIENTYTLVGEGVVSYAAGGTSGDFNNDGWQDIFIPGSDGQPHRLFINTKDGAFTDKAFEWGLTDRHNGIGVAVGDINSDGWLDIFMTSLGPPENWGPGHHKLYRNDRGIGFTDIAEVAGVQFTSTLDPDGFGAAFGDYDLDGDLDLCVAGRVSSSLFRNDGDESFTDVTVESGLVAVTPFETEKLKGFSPNFVDMDGDRYPELLFVSDFGRSKYFLNNSDGTFSDRTFESGTGKDQQGMGQTVGDFDGDGLLDWYVTSIYNLDDPDGEITHLTGNKLYLNTGNHRYDEWAQFAGVDDGGIGWGTLAVDFNHDGSLDIAETNGGHSVEFGGEPSYLWLNDGSGFFTERGVALGFEYTGHGRGMVNLDYDNDGDQDIVVFANGSPASVFRNDLQGPSTNWLRVFLDTSDFPGLAPNGFGSKVIATAGGRSRVRSVHGAESYLGKGELSAHFGIGSPRFVDELRVEWTDGQVTILESVTANQTITVSPAGTAGVPQKRGDCNLDGNLEVSDVVCLLGYLFLAEQLPCRHAAKPHVEAKKLFDANDDGRVSIVDATAVLFFLFRGEPQLSLGGDCVTIAGCAVSLAECGP